MNTFSLKVIACDKVFYDGRCAQVVLPLHDGLKAIQAHHENMVFAVEVGEIRILEENGNTIYGVTGTGFAQIINNRATVIVDTCESPEEIDVRRAQEAKERFLSKKDYDMLMNGLIKEAKLRERIAKLQRYRKMGIRTLEEVERFEKEGAKKEDDK